MIDKVYLRRVGPFHEALIDLGSIPHTTVILTGPNGSGKSTVLYGIAAALGAGLGQLGREWITPRFHDDEGLVAVRIGSETLAVAPLINGPPQRIPNPLEPAEELQLYSRDTLTRYSSAPEAPHRRWMTEVSAARRAHDLPPLATACFTYSGLRSVGESSLSAIQEQLENPMIDALGFQQTGVEKRLVQWVANNITKAAIAEQRKDHELAERYKSTLKQLEWSISQIADLPSFRFELETEPLSVVARRNGTAVRPDLLPDGLKSLLAWIGDIFVRLDRSRWQDSTAIHKRPIVVLMDEIDVHLHPAWQRRLLPMVSQVLPHAQLLVSTHSPFVVGSLEDACIVSLKLGPRGATVGGTFSATHGWSYETVLRAVFGIDDEFDIETEKRLDEFKSLRDRVLAGETGVDSLRQMAEQLSTLGDEVATLVTIELRQAERRIGAKR